MDGVPGGVEDGVRRGRTSELREAGESIAEVACDRILVLQIVEAGRSKAYHHTAGSPLHLDALDRAISGNASPVDHATFAKELRAAHSRKHSFWKLVDERCGARLSASRSDEGFRFRRVQIRLRSMDARK